MTVEERLHPVAGVSLVLKRLPAETQMPPANPALPGGRSRSLAANGALLAIGVAFLVPMLWVLLSSVDAKASWAMQLPHLTLANYRAALGGQQLQALLSSFILASVATALATVCAAPAAYALSRRRIPLKEPLLVATLFLSAVPLAILIIPIYELFARLGWLSILPAALFLAVTSLPFEIYLIKNFIDAVPAELEEAARMERASTRQVLLRVIVPLAAPGICVAAIFGFVNAWGSFVVPLVLITATNQQPGSVAIYSFISSVAIYYGAIAAFSVVYAAPVFALYGVASRLFKGGFVLGGAVKG